MFGRIANILGWAGVALVLAGVATWLFRDDLVTLRQGFALAGLVCILLYAASQWREMAATFARRPARYGALAVVSVVVVLGLLVGLNYLAEKYNKRWDLTASRDFTLSDQTRRVIASLKEPLRLLRLRPGRGHAAVPRSPGRVQPPLGQGEGRVHRPEQGSGAGAAVPDPDARHDRRRVPEARRARHQHDQRAGDHQRHHQGGAGAAAQAVLRHRPRREGSRQQRRARRLQLRPTPRCSATTTRSRPWRWRSSRTCPPTPRPSSSPARRATTWPPRSSRCAAT